MPDKLWEILLPSIPAWMLWPIAVVGLLLFLWPRVRAIWQEFVPSHRAYNRAKMALELQKLIYEIEALRGQVGERDVEQGLPEELRGTEQAKAFLRNTFARPAPMPTETITRGPFRTVYILYGGLGGLTVAILPIMQGGLEAVDWSHPAYLLGTALRAILLTTLGSLLVWVQKTRSAQEAFLIGAAPGLFVQLALGGLQPQTDLPAPNNGSIAMYTLSALGA